MSRMGSKKQPSQAHRPVYDLNQRPPLGLWLLLGLQHLFAMFGATILVPLLTNLEVSVALFTSGCGTLLYLVITKGRIPVYLGSSFAFIAPIVAGTQLGGPAGAMLGAFSAGAVYLAVGALIKLFGTRWLLNLLPPVVIGPVIIVIGLGLANIAVSMATSGGSNQYDLVNLLVAFVTLGCAVVFALVLRGIFSVIPILAAIICGYGFAAVFGLVDFGRIAIAPWFEVPNFSYLWPALNEGIPWHVLLILTPVAIVTICEHVGDQIVVSRITGRNSLKNPGLHRSLAGDGVATMVAALLGGPPNTTYGENIGVLAITRVYSVYVIALAAIFAIFLAFFSKFAVAVATIPVPVIGGVAIALFGAIAANGIRTLMEGQIDLAEKRNLLIASIILVLGVGGAVIKVGPHWQLSAMAVAAITGIVLHMILPGKETAGSSADILED